jgi:DNA-binding MarR family transcriptional regulator
MMSVKSSYLIIKLLSTEIFVIDSSQDLQRQVVAAAQDFGIGSVLFRNAIGRKLGLIITDIGCLNLLFIKGTSTPTELGRYTGLTSGSTTAMLDRLEKAGLVTRKPNPNDRRGVLVEVNQQSRDAIRPMVAGVQVAQSELLGRYSDEELAAIADFLTRFTKNVNDYTKTLEKDLS